jgi:hypothetical protein
LFPLRLDQLVVVNTYFGFILVLIVGVSEQAPRQGIKPDLLKSGSKAKQIGLLL